MRGCASRRSSASASTRSAYDELKDERARRERGEERRVVHVAVTRAKRRLIVSGAEGLEPKDAWQVGDKAVAPIRWMTSLMLPADVLARLTEVVDETVQLERSGHSAELRLAVNAPRTVGTVLRLTAAEPEVAVGQPAQLSLLEPVAPAAAATDDPAPDAGSAGPIARIAAAGLGRGARAAGHRELHVAQRLRALRLPLVSRSCPAPAAA